MKDINRIRLHIYGFLTLLVMTAIFILSAQDANTSTNLSEGFLKTLIGNFLGRFLPSLSAEGVYHDIRKYAHIFEFFCLGVTCSLFFSELNIKLSRAAVNSFVFSFVYACTDEFHQLFVPGRSGRFSDVCIDLAGAIPGIAAVILCLYFRCRKKHRKKC